ncbi:hypothetical protein NA57DRAFT_56131 [Rhizodiscina lignyota]|uniref:Uncharacterized protein n=1 Tax=Rhizodiscina lignyota TaxID=1504668 RepID=A0A9P4IEC8_9PEZI|nr:hypothetical protein NA57DRAFT_56131 [Rhizodiscina lignyota]
MLLVSFSLIALGAASAFPSSPGPISKRTIGKVTVCTDDKLGGECSTAVAQANQCLDFNNYDNQISSMQTDPGTFCWLYNQHGCTGAARGVLQDSGKCLADIDFDNVMSSMKCLDAASCFNCKVSFPGSP